MFWRTQDPWSAPPTPRGSRPRVNDTAFDLPPVQEPPGLGARPNPRRPDGAALMERVTYWYGERTHTWWAFVPAAGGYSERLLEGRSEAGLRADVARLCRALGSSR